MDISVIIPAYNYARYLPATIHSVLGQDTPGMTVEIIVIDDGSTDDTPAVAASFGEAIRYVRKNNQGLSAARNTGLSLVAGEFIVFLDADDLLTPGMLASQAGMLQTHPDVDIVICLNQLASSATPDSPLYSVGTWPLFKDNLPIHLCQFNIAPPHAYMLRRRVAERVGDFDISLKACEDHDYWLRCVAAGFTLAVNPEALVHYRKHADSMSAQTEKQLFHDALLHERVARLLSENTAFLAERREDALMAHAAGCLVTAASLAEMRPERSLQLIDLSCLAIKKAARERAMHPKRAPGGSEDTRVDADRDVLHAYALRTLSYVKLFKTLSHSGVHEAHAIWNKLYPHWRRPERAERELWQRIYVPQTLGGAWQN